MKDTKIHPNSLKNLKPNVWSKDNQPAKVGRKKGKTMRTLINEVAEHKILHSDVIIGAKRKLTINEAMLLTIIECALVKKEPWALTFWMKEMLHDGVDKLEVQEGLSPAARAVLEKAGALAQENNIIDVSPGS